MRRPSRCGSGFTIVEMMVIVGIVAILALMALPSYTDKIVRDQIAEALPLADIVKAPVAAMWTARKALPADNTAAGLPPAEKIVNNFISSVAVENGAIHITFGNRVNAQIKGKMLTLRPAVVEDAPVVPVTWVCGNAPPPDKMTAIGENRTDIPPLYLPFRCRA
jgi:type IV pilus assembly protein PilA